MWCEIVSFYSRHFIYFCPGYVFLASARTFSSCGKWELLLIAVHGLNSYGTQASLLCDK